MGSGFIEFNGIAAGMGPFGQRIHDSHHYLQRQYPAVFSDLSNQATGRLSTIKRSKGYQQRFVRQLAELSRSSETPAPPVPDDCRENENNVFDQHLLELALQQKGIETHRRDFS